MQWDDILTAFVPQLLATLVGGGIGVLAVWFSFRWQRDAARRDGVEAAADRLLDRLTDFVAAADAVEAESYMVNWAAGQRPRFQFPHRAPVSLAVERLRIATRGADREVADEIAETWNHVAHPGKEGNQVSAMGHLSTAIAKWRLGESRVSIADSLEIARLLASGDVEISPDEPNQ